MTRRDRPLDRAFDDGRGVELPNRGVLELSGSCTRPIYLKYAEFVDQERRVRCRNCVSCLRALRWQWALRAEWETLKAPDTWFFTGTFRAQWHDLERPKREVQLFIKRLRRRCDRKGTTLRYIMLPELHKSGAVHYHGLIHHDGQVTEQMVRDSWQAGFCFPSKVRNKRATAKYITKYCTKDMLGASQDERGRNARPRIMASINPTYGDAAVIRDADVLREIAGRQQEELQETWLKNLKLALQMERKSQEPMSFHRMVMERQAARKAPWKSP